MTLDHHKFQNAEIVDNKTVKGLFGDQNAEIEILDGGLPSNTFRVTLRQDMLPDGNVVIGAFVKGKDMPITVRGRIKNSIGR